MAYPHKSRYIDCIRALRPIAEGENETWGQEVDVWILEDYIVRDTCEEVAHVGKFAHVLVNVEVEQLCWACRVKHSCYRYRGRV